VEKPKRKKGKGGNTWEVNHYQEKSSGGLHTQEDRQGESSKRAGCVKKGRSGTRLGEKNVVGVEGKFKRNTSAKRGSDSVGFWEKFVTNGGSACGEAEEEKKKCQKGGTKGVVVTKGKRRGTTPEGCVI